MVDLTKTANKKSLKVLFIGDIFGKPGREAVKKYLAAHRKADDIDLVIANGENMAHGRGFVVSKYQELIDAGVDYFTSGNHIWANADIIPSIKDGSVKILRPANFELDSPGTGVADIEVDGVKISIVNLIGRVYIPILSLDPFTTADEIVASRKDSIIIVDMHAEATSEKMALGYYLDGRASSVLGTHTHIQTADEKILPNGTAYITDVGMTGPAESVLGVEKGIIIEKFLTGVHQSHKVASGEAIINAVTIEFDKKTKKALKIERINQLDK